MKNLLVGPNISLIQALKKISLNGEKSLIVVDSKKRLLGTISDGDIRKRLLVKKSLNSKINKIYNKHSTYLVKENFSKEQVKKFFLRKKFDLIPIINKFKVVVSYITWSQFLNDQNIQPKGRNINTAVIMAGGKGRRLKPFTQLLPKPLIPIKEKPIVDHLIDRFSKYKVKKIILSVNDKSNILKAYFSNNLKKNISFIEEKKPLGTAGSLYLLKDKIDKDFLLTNCDILADIEINNFYSFHKNNKNDISIVVSAKKYTIPYGVCFVDKKGLLSNIKEKPNYNFFINIGFYIINPKILSLIPKNKYFDMPDLISSSIKKSFKIGAYPIQDKEWIDVGQWSELKKVLEKF